MYETTPMKVYGVNEPFDHVVQITSEIVGDISVRVETDSHVRTPPASSWTCPACGKVDKKKFLSPKCRDCGGTSAYENPTQWVEPEAPRLPEIVIHTRAENLRRIRVVDDFGTTWTLDLSGLGSQYSHHYEWKVL